MFNLNKFKKMKKLFAIVCLIFTFSLVVAAPIGRQSDGSKTADTEKYVKAQVTNVQCSIQLVEVTTVPVITGSLFADVGTLQTKSVLTLPKTTGALIKIPERLTSMNIDTYKQPDNLTSNRRSEQRE